MLVKCEDHVPFPTGYTHLQIQCGILMGVDLFDFQLRRVMGLISLVQTHRIPCMVCLPTFG